MGKEIPACQFGFLTLTKTDDEDKIFIKASRIYGFSNICENDENIVTYVYLDGDVCYRVFESIQEIFNQLESIHPSLR